ncbi:MAG: tetratricopeptide repeat protein [Bacteroidales bacterium]|nr:tetratricopeptide repeat protein [Bacteroidales bacterium]
MRLILIITLLFILSNSSAQVVRDEYNKGKEYFKHKEYQKAKQKFGYVISHNTAYYEAYTYRARIYIALEMPDSALKDFKTSMSQKKDFLPNYYYRAQLYFSQKKYAKAEKDLNYVISNKSDFMPALLLRADIYELRGDDNLAFNDYNALIKSGSKHYKVYYRRGLYYSKQKKNTSAIKDFTKALSFKPKYAPALYALANSYQILGENNKAIEYYSQVIAVDQTYKKAYEQRAYLYYFSKQYEKGLEDDRHIVSYFRLRSDTLFIRMAKAEMAMKDYSSADRYLSKALSANSKSTEALLMRAKVAIKRDRASTALSYLQRIHRINANEYESWYLQGEIRYEAKEYEKALVSLTECIKIKKVPKAYYLRGAVYSALRDGDNACKDTKQAAELGHKQAKKDQDRVCKGKHN